MNKPGLLLIAASCVGVSVALAAAQDPKPLPSIEVTAPKDIASLKELDATLHEFGVKVTACVTAGGTREKCLCSDPKDLASLRSSYEALIKLHPDWKDQVLNYQYLDKDQKNVSGMFVLQNLRRQLEMLKCE